jgi:hypothetical protein
MNAPFTQLGLRQLILDALRNTSSDKPISETDLHFSSFADYSYQQILDELEALYEAKKILRVLITRDGLSQQYYWISLMAGRMPEKMPHNTSFLAPKRVDQRQKPITHVTSITNISETQNMTFSAEKSIAWRMLEFIEANPDTTSGPLRSAMGVSTVDGYLATYIKRGHLLKYKDGDGFGYKFKLKPGMTAQQIFSAPRLSSSVEKLAALDSKNDTPAAAQIAKDDIPAFLRKQTEPEPDKQAETSAATTTQEPYGQFKAAYTSAGTLMLFGLSFQPIELSREKTTDLFEFLNQQLSLIGV